MTSGIRWVGGNIGWIGGRPGVADGRRSPAHSARSWSIAWLTPLDGGVGLVRDAHLLEPQREPGAEAHHDPPGQDLVERGAGHRQHDRMAGERVDRAERDPEAGLAIVAAGSARALATAVAKLIASRSK